MTASDQMNDSKNYGDSPREGHVGIVLNYRSPSGVARPSKRGPVAIVVTSGFVSTIIAYGLAVKYGSFGAAEWLFLSMIPVIALGAIAMGIAYLSPHCTRRRKVILWILPLAPSIVLWITVIAHNNTIARTAPYDRIRDLLGEESLVGVVDPAFINRHESQDDDSLIIRFRFKGDFDRILKANGFTRVEAGHLINMNDRFNYYEYLKIGLFGRIRGLIIA